MNAVAPERWEISFPDVTGRTKYRIRISDPNACTTHDPNGASTQNILANGVPLTRIVSTPGNGPEPGLAFTGTEVGRIIS